MSAFAAEPVYDEYMDALLLGDRRRAFAILDAARREGLGLDPLYLEVLQPALREIGRLWQLDQLNVAQEHLATAITQAAMTRLLEGSFSGPGPGGPTLVATCVDVERHEVGLRMICDLLELRGWNTFYLGAAVPVESLVSLVAMKSPTAVAISVSLSAHLPRLRLAAEQLRRSVPDPPFILAGGRPLLQDPTLAERLGADATAPDAGAAVALLEARFGRG